MNVQARGVLRHHFWGEYRATIGLSFTDAASATDARRVLGDAWKPGKDPAVLIWHGGSAELEEQKAALCAFALTIVPCSWEHCADRCADQEIDGLPHSIDIGPPFTVTIPVVPAEQTELFGEP